MFYGACSLINLVSIFYYSSVGGALISDAAINWKFSLGFYVASFVALLPIGISLTYWYEGVLWHNLFEQDRLQWQPDRSNVQNPTNNQQYNYIQVPTDFNSAMGGLKSPSEMARTIEKNMERRQMNEQV